MCAQTPQSVGRGNQADLVLLPTLLWGGFDKGEKGGATPGRGLGHGVEGGRQRSSTRGQETVGRATACFVKIL